MTELGTAAQEGGPGLAHVAEGLSLRPVCVSRSLPQTEKGEWLGQDPGTVWG